MSHRVFWALLFGVVVVGVALYTASHSTIVVPPTQAQQPIPQDPSEQLTLTPADWDPTYTPTSDVTSTTTETAHVTNLLLNGYITETQRDTYTPETREHLVAQATAEALTLVQTDIPLSALTLTQETGIVRVSAYKNELYDAIKPIFDLDEYELTIYARATEQNNASDFEKLANYAQIYRTAGEAARSVVTPADGAQEHLAVVNALTHFAKVLDALAAGFNDPSQSLSGVYNFTTAEQELGKVFDTLNIYFITKGINTK